MLFRLIRIMYLHQLRTKQVFGITFEQGRNELKIDDNFFCNIVTENKELTDQLR